MDFCHRASVHPEASTEQSSQCLQDVRGDNGGCEGRRDQCGTHHFGQASDADGSAKVALIAIGITPFIARDIQRRAQEIPAEQLIKAQTLGGNTAQILIRVLLPQLLPKLIDAIRLSLGTGWLFLIAAEAIAATDGLGYRIFLVRRYMSMDVILPYVAWITLLAFVLDIALAWLNRRLFPWHAPGAQT